MGTARVVLLGEEFTLKGDTDEVHLQRVATEVEALMRKIADDMDIHGQPSKVATRIMRISPTLADSR